MSDQWQLILRPRLQDNALADRLAAKLGATANVVVETQAFVSENPTTLTSIQIQQLLFILDVYEAVHMDYNASPTNFVLLRYLTSDLASIQTLDDVARRYYTLTPDPQLAGTTSAQLDEFRKALLRTKPAAVLAGLLASGAIHSDDSLVQAQAVKLFDQTVAQGFLFLSKSIGERCAELPPADISPGLRSFAEALQRLYPLVSDARHLQNVLSAGFHSARDISSAPDAYQALLATNLDPSAAVVIVSRAEVVTKRNSQLWTEYLRGRTNVPILAVDDGHLTKEQLSRKDGATLRAAFGDLDSFEMDYDMSALGPAAYLVDLFEFMRHSPLRFNGKDSNLLNVFWERRPDLKSLQLSKPNTVNTVRYADLVNETLESYIAYKYLDTRAEMMCYNEGESAQSLSAMTNTNWSVYSKLLSQAVSPIPDLPFNLATASVRAYLDALGTTRWDVLRVFDGITERSGQSLDQSSSVRQSLLNESSSRRSAAEYLGLDQQDFVAICGEAFQSFDSIRIKQDSQVITRPRYDNLIGLLSAGEYWGFQAGQGTTADQKMLSLDPLAPGIAFISEVLLARANIKFEELLEILRTTFMGNRLVITVQKSKNTYQYSEKTEDMRLTFPSDFSDYLTDIDGAEQARALFHLQAFIRLWKATGWSIPNLDTALVCSSSQRLSGPSMPTNHVSISPQAIIDIAAIHRISSLTVKDIQALLPIWSSIDAEGPQSLYFRLFMSSSNLRQYPGLALDSDDQQMNFQEMSNLIQTALRIRDVDLQLLLDAAGLSLQSPWTLENISGLYRSHILAQIFDISARDLRLWYQVFPRAQYVTNSPSAALQALEMWHEVCDSGGWSSSALLEALATSTPRTPSPSDPSVPKTCKMLQLLHALSAGSSVLLAAAQSTDSTDNGPFSPGAVREACNTLYVPELAKVTYDTVQGTMTYSASLDAGVTVSVPKDLQRKVTIRNSKVLVQDMLLTVEQSQLLALSNDAAWKVVITDILSQQQNVAKVLKDSLGLDVDSSTLFKLAPLSQDLSIPERLSDYEKLERRKTFLLASVVPREIKLGTESLTSEIFSFPLNQQLLETTVATTVKATGISATIGDLISPKLLHINESCVARTSDAFSGWFVAPANGDYTLLVTGKATEVMVVFKGKTLQFDKNQAQIQGLLRNVTYYIQATGPDALKRLKFSVPGHQPRGLAHDVLVAENTVVLIQQVLDVSSGLSTLLAKENLQPDDISRLLQSGVNLVRPAWTDLLALQQYRKLSKAIPTESWKLLNYLEACTQNVVSQDDLLSQVAACLGATPKVLSQAVGLLCGPVSVNEQAYQLSRVPVLLKIQDIIKLASSLGVGVDVLHGWCEMHLPRETDAQYAIARAIQSTATAVGGGKAVAAAERLANLKRKALVSWLTPRIDGAQDSEDLMGYFLVDVNMGPQQMTSRVRQALSSVQFFIQRCLLGLEAGVARTVVNADRWAWMQKFTLWQANRKVFLYPENWIDPALRRDQSDAFQAIKTAVLQSDLSIQTINTLLRKYIYETNEIADLEVQNYLCEGENKDAGVIGIYHFFARTRAAPYRYYYRQLKMIGSTNTDSTPLWMPWTRMNLKIDPVEADWDGTTLSQAGTFMVPALYRGRFFLFMPQVLLKSEPKQVGGDGSQTPSTHATLTLETYARNAKMAEVQPSKFWEIKLGWTEFLNGQWSPQYVSNASLKIESDPFNRLPSVASFRFTAGERPLDSQELNAKSSNNEILVIDVAKAQASGKPPSLAASLTHLGRFELRGTQIVVADDKRSVITNAALATRFNKITYTTTRKTIDDVKSDMAVVTQGEGPLLAFCPEVSSDMKDVNSQQITWTLAYNRMQYQKTVGLVVERTTASRVESYFGYPALDGNFTMKADQRSTTAVQRLAHDVAQPLMEQATSTDDIQALYRVLVSLPEEMREDAFGSLGGDMWHELGTPYSIYNWELGFHIFLLLVERLAATQQYDLALQVASVVFDIRGAPEPSNPSSGLFIKPPVDASASNTGGDTNVKPKGPFNRPPGHAPASDTGGNMNVKPNSADPTVKRMKPTLTDCWRFPPFKSAKLRAAGSIRDLLKALTSKTSSDEITQWLNNPFDPDTVARDRPAVYMRRFITKYVEILIAQGDVYFRQESLESMPMAVQKYIEASHLFGKAPRRMPPPTKASSTKTYAEISNPSTGKGLNAFSGTTVDLELVFPFFVDSVNANDAPHNVKSSGVLGLVPTDYFPVPPNPQVAALRDLIDDRLFKVRNSLDINGNFRQLALFEPPLDPGMLVKAVSGGTSITSLYASIADGPMPNYRFALLLQKAFELCAELKAMCDAYLQIKEKRDSEQMSLLRSKQELALQGLTMDMKKMQRDDAQSAVAVLEETRSAHVMRLKYYLALTGETRAAPLPAADSGWSDIEQSIEKPTKDELAMNSQERIEMQKCDEAATLGGLASAIETVSSVLLALPNIEENVEPVGVGATLKFDAGNIGQGMLIAAGVIKNEAQAAIDMASKASRKNRLIQQLQERRFQANMAAHDIINVDKQLESQRLKIKMCELDIQTQEQQTADALATDEFLRTKYTSQSLYAWYDTSLRQTAYNTYLLAMDAAKNAERAFSFERSSTRNAASGSVALSSSYWDDSRDGFLSAQSLYLGLRRLEAAHMRRDSHDFELSKHVSLRNIDPLALLRLQTDGKATFALPEALFDFDFPGHYCRRIKSVSLTIPCIVGPYTGPCCTMKLLENCYRVKQKLDGADYYPTSLQADERFHSDHVPITTIAMSSGQQDDGTFRTGSSGDRYGPFEGAGVISRWSIELPVMRQFDYRSISDVILRLDYTALDGGKIWHDAAISELDKLLANKANFVSTTLVELTRNPNVQSMEDSESLKVTMKDIRSQLPYWARARNASQATIVQASILSTSGQKLTGATLNETQLSASNVQVSGYSVVEVAVAEAYDWEDIKLAVPRATKEQLLGKEQRLWMVLSYVLKAVKS